MGPGASVIRTVLTVLQNLCMCVATCASAGAHPARPHPRAAAAGPGGAALHGAGVQAGPLHHPLAHARRRGLRLVAARLRHPPHVQPRGHHPRNAPRAVPGQRGVRCHGGWALELVVLACAGRAGLSCVCVGWSCISVPNSSTLDPQMWHFKFYRAAHSARTTLHIPSPFP